MFGERPTVVAAVRLAHRLDRHLDVAGGRGTPPLPWIRWSAEVRQLLDVEA